MIGSYASYSPVYQYLMIFSADFPRIDCDIFGKPSIVFVLAGNWLVSGIKVSDNQYPVVVVQPECELVTTEAIFYQSVDADLVAKLPFQLQQIWAIWIRLEWFNKVRDLDLFNLAVDSKVVVAI
jgi:hypothetical protein